MVWRFSSKHTGSARKDKSDASVLQKRPSPPYPASHCRPKLRAEDDDIKTAEYYVQITAMGNRHLSRHKGTHNGRFHWCVRFSVV